ncbi:MAG: hypothetical protein AAFV29_00770, partial [Myxococcota bacterium]
MRASEGALVQLEGGDKVVMATADRRLGPDWQRVVVPSDGRWKINSVSTRRYLYLHVQPFIRAPPLKAQQVQAVLTATYAVTQGEVDTLTSVRMAHRLLAVAHPRSQIADIESDEQRAEFALRSAKLFEAEDRYEESSLAYAIAGFLYARTGQLEAAT